jgi:RimJ/RimL family protein N-acetyltransferase
MESRKKAENKTYSTTDGQRIVLRQPEPPADLERLLAFFERLPPEVRNYMRHDAQDRAAVERRLSQVDNVSHWRLVAELDGEIVADATLDREPFNWSRHVAEIRPIIDPHYLHRGIRALLCRELLALGRAEGIERLFTEVSPEQTDLIGTLEREGFAYEATRKKYAKDHEGRVHDIVLMSSDVGDIWERLQLLIETLDGVHLHDGRY